MSTEIFETRPYTYLGRFPEELPGDWKSPDGVWMKLREMSDEELAELGWFPVQSVEYDYTTEMLVWNGSTKSYDVVPMPEPTASPENYVQFWNLLLGSSVYQKLRNESKQSLEVNAICTELIALLNDAKSGRENKPAIQNSIDEIISSNILTEEELIELQQIFESSRLNLFYSLVE